MSGIQGNVAQNKERHPDKYCPVHRCLWRTNDGSLCPRHARKEDPACVDCTECEPSDRCLVPWETGLDPNGDALPPSHDDYDAREAYDPTDPKHPDYYDLFT